jgi:hypothetical protein
MHHQLVVLPVQFGKHTYLKTQQLRVDGFINKIYTTHFITLKHILLILVVRRYEDDRNMLELITFVNKGCGFKAVHVGHLHVH